MAFSWLRASAGAASSPTGPRRERVPGWAASSSVREDARPVRVGAGGDLGLAVEVAVPVWTGDEGAAAGGDAEASDEGVAGGDGLCRWRVGEVVFLPELPGFAPVLGAVPAGACVLDRVTCAAPVTGAAALVTDVLRNELEAEEVV